MGLVRGGDSVEAKGGVRGGYIEAGEPLSLNSSAYFFPASGIMIVLNLSSTSRFTRLFLRELYDILYSS